MQQISLRKDFLISINMFLILAIVVLKLQTTLIQGQELSTNLKVLYAINAGGYDHIDKNGIHYDADPLTVGTASDYGNHLLLIGRVPEQDDILYRTERYHTSTFGYNIPVSGDGKYALVLKFCEVYFNDANMKVFDVLLNRQHVVVSQLDIFAQVGRGTAHEEYVFFNVVKNRLHFNGEASDIKNNMVRLEFLKGNHDNPKINAFVLFKGEVQRIPRLEPLNNESLNMKGNRKGSGVDSPGSFGGVDKKRLKESEKQITSQRLSSSSNHRLNREDDEYEEDEEDDGDMSFDDEEDGEEEEEYQGRRYSSQHDEGAGGGAAEEDDFDELSTIQRKSRKTSGPRHPNPYEMMDESSMFMPFIVAIGAFIPLLFCLCKL